MKSFKYRHHKYSDHLNISDSVGAPEASVSARYRDLVRLGYGMEKKNLGRGTWLYRMKVVR